MINDTDTGPAAETAENGAPTSEGSGVLDEQRGALIDRVAAFTAERTAGLYRDVENEVFAPLFEAFRKAARFHESALQNLGLDAEPASLDAPTLLAYRRRVVEEVLTPIQKQLESSYADLLARPYQAMFSALRKDAAWGPDVQIVPEPASLFKPAGGDTAWISLQKLIHRRRRSLQRAGRSVRRLIDRRTAEAHTYSQIVPVRQLLAFHLHERLPQCLLAEFEKTHQMLAGVIAEYEKAQTEWTYAILSVKQKIAGPDYMLPSMAPWIQEEASTPPAVEASVVQRVMTRADALQAALSLTLDETGALHEQTKMLLADALNAFKDDLTCGGTFLLSMNERALPPASQQATHQLQEIAGAWMAWYQEVRHRLHLNTVLHDWRDTVLNSQQQLFKSIADASLTPILDSFGRLKKTLDECAEEANVLFEGHRKAVSFEELAEALRPLHQNIARQFKFILNDLTSLLKAGQALEEPGTNLWRRILEKAESAPEILPVHKPDAAPFPSSPEHHPFDLNLREAITGALLQPLPSQLAPPARSLQKAVVRTWEETQQVEHMVDYNLNAALSELSAPPAQTPVEEESVEEHDPFAAAQELVATGLVRSAEKLGELAIGLNTPWRAFVDVAFNALLTYSRDIHSNISAEDNLHDWRTSIRIGLNRRKKHIQRQTRDAFERGQSWINRLIRRGQRQTRQLIKKGQSAVGVVGQNEDQWLQTLQIAADVDTLHKRLPLVYRRLFSLKPLEELDLLEGRKLDIAFVKKHYERWQKSQTGPLIMAMPYGSGRTSLMNVLSQSVFLDADVQLIHMGCRYRDADEWATVAATALGIPFEGAMTLDMLETRLMALPRGDKPRVAIIDRLELLMLSTPGGEKLVERILIFLSRTDNAVYWVANIGRHAWHFIEKTMRPSTGFISAYRVTQLQRQALEDIILKRHNRSGMALRFKATSAPSSFFDFYRQKDEETLQKTIQGAFFDRLYRLSGQNVLLALVYWLRAVEFDKENDTLLVNALEPINFTFLETLDLTRAFTLKSFLIHRTLTLEEHMRVFRMTSAESTIILESLLNLAIIEPILKDEHLETRHFRIMSDLPYRIHPLIVHPVTEFLRKLHIIY